MPRHHPGPSHDALRRFRRIVKYMAAASLVIAALAVALVASGNDGPHVRMLIAAALAVGLGVFVAAALGLVFLASASGHDARANRYEENDE